ncbi:LamG-like jellyroll fold domain-containing protein [Streptomyces sp. NPDC012888]|uniref:LamG-like jellyroll fold domain-containing protein n=1 Tax=Streptomyces sp. NPDC012888 TaxID=3364855 RepID=UPI00368E9FA4
MTDGTDRNHSPQPDPAPGNGGYGYPAGPTPGGYGYPQPGQPGPYQPPQPQPWAAGLPTEPGAFGPPPVAPPQPEWQQQPAPEWQQGPYPQPGGEQPDWQAMADENESRRGRKKKVLAVVAGVLVIALAGGGGYFALKVTGEEKKDDKKPVASGSPSPSGSGAAGGESKVIADPQGKLEMSLGPDASTAKSGERTEARFKGGQNSWGQAPAAAVDVAKSFTVSAKVLNKAEKGTKIAVSQSAGDDFSFALGYEEKAGKKRWVFRVRTAGKDGKPVSLNAFGDASKNAKSWVRLTGAYDAEKKAVTLYVDDKAADTTAVPKGIFGGQGPAQLGRAHFNGGWVAPWVGSLYEVRTWNAALTAEQVAAMKEGKPAVEPAHSWLAG